jgi:hypothetical protein
MIKLCPFCGYKLSSMLMLVNDGITTCDNCNRVFDSSIYHRLLSAAWMVRRWHVEDVESLKQRFGFSEAESNLLYKYVIENRYSHDDFIKVLDEIDLDCEVVI